MASQGIPQCERMKSRNESFDDSNDIMSSDTAAAVSATRRGGGTVAASTTSDENRNADGNGKVGNSENNDDNNRNENSSSEDCLQFFDATQYLNNNQSDDDDAHDDASPEQRNDGHFSKAEEELHEAVAYSTALVGENVMDSPGSGSARKPKVANPKRKNNSNASWSSSLSSSSFSPGNIPCLRHRPAGSNKSSSNNNSKKMNAGLSAGLVAQGYAWVRTQRESRQRRFLQYQAEQQFRKIKAAQEAERYGKDSGGSKGLFSNQIFQNLRFVGGIEGGSGDDLRRGPSSSRSESDNLDEFLDADDGHATVSASGMGYTVELAVSDSEDEDASWIPPVRLEEEDLSEENATPCLLNKEQRQQIAQHVLPTGIAYAKWKRIYSLSRDGDSFETCLRLVKDYNQSLLIVRTSKNELFGGYADASWEHRSGAGARFYGGSNSCLFSVPDSSKGKIKAYRWTGANRYIQLTDSHRKVLAFGGGGSEGSFGLCVESDFQRGSTGPCATFGNEPLCSEENFLIVDVEIFGFMLGQF